eukprot:CAMPEP_0170522254 /NCGR_PEP_ID=MMETSP0209-20121228/7714_1 /TAXON_ID=665100 ORGANISM="Litonotus pictus, Strain P1" /NCGR_SAMPLE_ID=MMETSP0209 /ASSEMBLY_ACC=CAM_ASM_000301 /LENGTH=252 /DNA_ID=CAMNT_0010809685 /DNA_START=26 /DNA_END=784 /DNA_ORIENTATION=+
MALDEVNGVDNPPNLMFNIERSGYLVVAIRDILTNFEKYFPVGYKEGDLWFSLNNTPLKWNLPFGVILDSLVRDTSDLPIYITAHFRNFPEQQLIRYKNLDTLRFYYLNSLKEACTLRNGSAKEVLNLSTRETNKLLEIVFNPNKMFKDFWDLQSQIFDKSINKRFPAKFVFNKTDIVLTKPFNVWEENSLDLDLKHFILSSFDKEATEHMLSPDCKILINSNEFDLSTPMIFLVANFSYMDMFLYINIVEC